jgi:hypothetical protein
MPCSKITNAASHLKRWLAAFAVLFMVSAETRDFSAIHEAFFSRFAPSEVEAHPPSAPAFARAWFLEDRSGNTNFSHNGQLNRPGFC